MEGGGGVVHGQTDHQTDDITTKIKICMLKRPHSRFGVTELWTFQPKTHTQRLGESWCIWLPARAGKHFDMVYRTFVDSSFILNKDRWCHGSTHKNCQPSIHQDRTHTGSHQKITFENAEYSWRGLDYFRRDTLTDQIANAKVCRVSGVNMSLGTVNVLYLTTVYSQHVPEQGKQHNTHTHLSSNNTNIYDDCKSQVFGFFYLYFVFHRNENTRIHAETQWLICVSLGPESETFCSKPASLACTFSPQNENIHLTFLFESNKISTYPVRTSLTKKRRFACSAKNVNFVLVVSSTDFVPLISYIRPHLCHKQERWSLDETDLKVIQTITLLFE